MLLYKDRLGIERTVYCKSPRHILAVCKPDEGITESGIVLAAHQDFPITQGFISDLPADLTYVNQIGGLQIGDHVVFHRYANELVCEDHYYNEDLDLHVIDQIYTLHIDDLLVALKY